MEGDNVTILIGNIIHCTAGYELHVLEKGYVIVEGQKILDVGEENSLETRKFKLGLKDDDVINTILLKNSQILIPGLVDTHIHAPQYPNIGLGYDKPLLDWLDTYTYPLEKQYKDLKFAEKVYNAVVRRTLDHGTTTSCYFGSLYEISTIALVDAAIKHGQRALVGKINMITLAPDDYVETHEESINNTKKFIEEVASRKSDLVKPVITPRFALSVNMDLMKDLATIAKENDLHIQSHISENLAEIQMVREWYGTSYAEVYEQAGLLTNKTVLAHGVHLSDDELSLLAQRGTSIAHCADSNTCLKSGMCDVRKLQSYGIKIGLGTDVAGGSSPSIVRAMKSTLNNSIHLSIGKENYTPLSYKDVFYMATFGGAEALALDEQVGNFVPGKYFDALIIDMDVENGGSDYLVACDALELLQKFIYVGDDRNVLKVYVAGNSVK